MWFRCVCEWEIGWDGIEVDNDPECLLFWSIYEMEQWMISIGLIEYRFVLGLTRDVN